MKERHDPAAAVVSRTLAAGVGASVLLMAAGLVLSFASGHALPEAAPSASRLLSGALALDPAALMSLGVVVLLATPAARVAVLCWQFLKRREWRMAAVSLIVLTVLAGSVLLGRGG
jgi:uncharacterized membrane protein